MPKYDVAVVGAGLGGLVAAALLSSKKKKIVVIEPAESLNSALGIFEKDGFIFSGAPSMSYGFQRGGAISELSAVLGILQDVSVISPCYQVALPDHRITVYVEQNETLDELRREFPKEIDTLSKFYRDLHKEAVQSNKNRFSAYLTRHRTAAGFLRKYRFSRELTAFFDVQSLYFHQRPVMDLPFTSLIDLCDTPPLHLHGGFKQFSNRLYGIILQQGGEVRYHEQSPELVLRYGSTIGIKTVKGSLDAGCILLDDIQQDHPTLYLGLSDKVVPVGMSQQVLFLPDYALPRDFIALSLSADDNTASAPPGLRALTATVHSQQPINVEKRDVIERIGKLIPFLDDYTVLAGEQRREKKTWVIPPDLAFRPLRREGGASMLFRGSKKNVYLLKDNPEAPLQTIVTAQRFVKKMI